MSDFDSKQWNAYCQRLKQTAEYLADGNQELSDAFTSELEQIVSAEDPQSYSELLDRIQEASQTVENWQQKSPVISDNESKTPSDSAAS